jgi:hypothetical protein
MAAPRSARLTRREGMKFAFTLGAAFSVLSALLAFRHRTLGAEGTFALGVLFLLAGLLAPTHLGPVQRAWMALGHTIGRVTGPIALGLIYYVALTPIGYVRRTFGRSPLARNPGAPTFWIPRARNDGDERRRAMERQF